MNGSIPLAKLGVVLAGAFAAISTAAAADSAANTFDEGYYYNYDHYDAANPSYLTGQLVTGTGDDTTLTGFHSFFAFNALTGLDGPITSATLTIEEPAGGYSSVQPSETFNLTAFVGDIATLTTSGDNLGEYTALGNGTVVGTATIGPANDGSSITIHLNPDGISYLNSRAGQQFAFGGFLSGLSLLNLDTRYVFGGSEVLPVTSTVLDFTTAPVPEAPTLSLAGVGLLSLLGITILRHRARSAMRSTIRR